MALYGVIAVWTAFAWESSSAPIEHALNFSEAKTLKPQPLSFEPYGPFYEASSPQAGSNIHALEERSVSQALMHGLSALYLSDFETDEEALEAWRYYKAHVPVLNFFQPFSVSNEEDGGQNGISLMALLGRMDMPPAAARDVMQDTCDSLGRQGYICVPVEFALNLNGWDASLEAMPVTPNVMASYDPQEAWDIAQKQRRRSFVPDEQPIALSGLNNVEPAAGLYDALEAHDFSANSLPVDGFDNAPGFGPNAGGDDTVAQAAMRAAFDMVRNRYADAVYQAQASSDGIADLSSDDALALTQGAITSAAERAFEKFMQDSFGKRDFEGRTYDGVRGYFMTAFSHAASASLKSVGRRFVNDVTSSGGNFKSLEIRSELLDGVDEAVASALIDTGLAAAKNSQYAFLRNLEVSYKIRENSKPEYSILTTQPLYSSQGRRHNLFAQAAVSHEGGRNSMTGGLAYRYMPMSEKYLLGSNVFVDYERPYNHVRASAGLDFQTSLYGASANYYKGLTDWHDSETGFQEKPLDGWDVELSGRMPFLPALEVFGRGYRWQALEGADDITGREARIEYSPVPAFTIEGLWNEEDDAETEYGLGVRYNYKFGAPSEYLYDWNEQFRQKSAVEYVFRKVRRDNKIRVQTRVDPDGPLGGGATPIGPALLASVPVDGTAGVSIGTDVTLTFAADVLAGVGNIVFTDLTDASDDFTIPVGDARVGIVNNVVTIDLSAQLLEFSTNYEVTFAAGVFTDTGGAPSPELASGDVDFTTVVDPTAGFPAPTVSMAPGTTSGSHEDAQDVGTWQTTIDVGAAPDGVIFESGATGQGIAASFGGGNLVFAAGDGASFATGADSIFGSIASASVANGLHHFVFVADPDAAAEIGLYVDGIRVINQSIAGSMQSGEWAGTNGAGYGLLNSAIRNGVDNSALTGATLTNNLSFWTNQQPADF